jgi:Phosphate transport (Pho88)
VTRSPLLSPLVTVVFSEGGKAVETTNKAYDELKLRQQVKQGLITPIIVLVLHLYFGFFPPIIIQSVLTVANTLTTELSRLHLLTLLSSSPPAKDLKRPWRVKGMLGQFREMKKEVMKELNEGKEGGTGSRKNKKNENRRKGGK